MDYLNEINPDAIRWLRELVANGSIPESVVDERSVEHVQADDVIRYRQCHWFAGIAGWPLSLRLAGCEHLESLWTGSCPCGPFSTAGKRGGYGDTRDFWPSWFWVIRSARPMLVFGEQVSSAIKFGWCDRLFDDMESEGYIGWSCVLGAHSVGAPHERQRLYWAFANTADHGLEGVQRRIEAQVSKDWTPEALAAWNTTGSAFGDWRKLLAEPNVCRVDDGVSSTVDIRPRLHAYGNAIVPQVGALFVRSFIGGLLEKS